MTAKSSLQQGDLAKVSASEPYKQELEQLRTTIKEMQLAHMQELQVKEPELERRLHDQKQSMENLLKFTGERELLRD